MNPEMIDRVFALASENARLGRIERQAILAMAHIALGTIDAKRVEQLLPKRSKRLFAERIAPNMVGQSRYYRNKALIITFHLLGISEWLIAEFTGYSLWTVRRFMRRFRNKEYDRLFNPPKRPLKIDCPELNDKLFATLHAPPSDYGINRTTWTIDLLSDVLRNEGSPINKNAISKMIRRKGYAFRKTREVLTSNDPDYREKLEKITRTLRRLGPADRFFSIDEYGPVSIKERGGRRRVRRGEIPTVPQYQDSKGFLIVTAALELTTNRISHFYSRKKDTEEMIKLLHVLLDEYWDCRRLYFSWDAASWHSSRKFLAEVKRVNSTEYRQDHQSPTVKLMPLPARAQFLNVIESVFSGLSQSVIHNSNYPSLDAAKAAIDRYFNERNAYFRKNPRKAGNKIWGQEQVPSYFSVSHTCKDPRFLSLNAVR